MSDFGITCRCSHTDDMGAFGLDEGGLALPLHHYRCPACGVCWSVQSVGKATVLPTGQIIPAQRRIVVTSASSAPSLVPPQ